MEIINGEKLKEALIAGYEALNNNKEAINVLNVFPVPDGDTGTNMSLTMRSAVKSISEVEDKSIGAVAKALSSGSLMGARGNSGVILSQLCRGVYKAFKKKETANIEDVNQAFISAKETAYKAVMKPTEGTILTVAREMAEFSEANYKKYTDLLIFIRDTLNVGKDALRKTPDMLPALKEAGVVDAGGQGLLTILEGAVLSLEGKSIDGLKISDFDEDKEDKKISEYDYKIEFYLLANEDVKDNFENEVSHFSNTSVEVRGSRLMKVTSETNNPGQVLELAINRGAISDLTLENLSLEENIEDLENEEFEEVEDPETRKTYGFVSVSLGDGFSEIFKNFGVDEIISGGQTMNPSTEDILKAVKRINADNIFILPNNKNIIMAAKQVNYLTDKNIITLETKTIPQGFSSLLEFDESKTVEENAQDMADAIHNIKTLQITYSVRDTNIDGMEIKKGEYIGLFENKLVSHNPEIYPVLEDLLTKAEPEDLGLISVYYGQDVTEEACTDLVERLKAKFKADFEIINGGQPLYYYIVSVE